MINLAIIAILGSCLGCPAGNIIGWAVARRRDQALGTEPFNWRLVISGKLYYEWWKQHWQDPRDE